MSCFIVLLNLMVIICEKLKQSEIRVVLTRQLIVIAISFCVFRVLKRENKILMTYFMNGNFIFPC